MIVRAPCEAVRDRLSPMRGKVRVDGPRRVVRGVVIIQMCMDQRQIEGHRLERDAQHGRRELTDHRFIIGEGRPCRQGAF